MTAHLYTGVGSPEGKVAGDAGDIFIASSGSLYLKGQGSGSAGWLTLSVGGTPGGSDKQIQFNDAGVFGGNAGLTFDKSTGAFKVGAGDFNAGGSTLTPAAAFTFRGAGILPWWDGGGPTSGDDFAPALIEFNVETANPSTPGAASHFILTNQAAGPASATGTVFGVDDNGTFSIAGFNKAGGGGGISFNLTLGGINVHEFSAGFGDVFLDYDGNLVPNNQGLRAGITGQDLGQDTSVLTPHPRWRSLFLSGDANIGGNVGFYGATPAAKPTITGSRGANAALASLLTQLATLGLLTDSTS